MTAADREMLEMAAKASGICHLLGAWFDDGRQAGFLSGRLGNGRSVWNPLADDGDALRLAVKLSIAVWFVSYPHGLTGFPGGDFVKAVGIGVVHIPLDVGDNTAATRRAIVQAAAAIGGAMP